MGCIRSKIDRRWSLRSTIGRARGEVLDKKKTCSQSSGGALRGGKDEKSIGNGRSYDRGEACEV